MKKYFSLLFIFILSFFIFSSNASALSFDAEIEVNGVDYPKFSLNNSERTNSLTFNKSNDFNLSSLMPPYYGIIDNKQMKIEDYFNKTIDGYYFRMLVSSNSDTKYYVAPNKLYIPIRLQTTNIDENYVLYVFNIYAKCDYDTPKINCQGYRLLDKSHITASISYDLDSSHQDVVTTSCVVTPSDNYTHATIGCRYPKNLLLYHRYLYLMLDLNNDIYSNFTPSTGETVYQNFYDIYLNKQVYYEGSNKPIIDLTTSVDNDSVTLTTTKSDNIAQYCFEVTGSVTHYECTTSNTITLKDLSNGDYTASVSANYNDGTTSGVSYANFTITNSVKPILKYLVTYADKSLYVDMRGSYGINADIAYYYLKLDDGEWIKIESPQYTFTNVDFGGHNLQIYIEDTEGNTSAISNYNNNFQSPEEINKNFFDYVKDFFNSFFDYIKYLGSLFEKFFKDSMNFFQYLSDTFMHLFIPTEEEMNNLINTMQSAFEEKLGFLGQSLTFVVDEFNYLILKPDPFTGLCIPKISLPSEIANLDIISSETCLNDSIMSNFSLATNMIKIVNSFMLIGWFLSFAYNELQKWLGGNY